MRFIILFLFLTSCAVNDVTVFTFSIEQMENVEGMQHGIWISLETDEYAELEIYADDVKISTVVYDPSGCTLRRAFFRSGMFKCGTFVRVDLRIRGDIVDSEPLIIKC